MLSDFEIQAYYEQGDIIIEPFNKDQINPNSYDVRLGEHFWVMHGGSQKFDREDTSKNFKPVHVKKGPFEFHPGCFVLAHTEEFIGAIQNFAPMLETKSSIARAGLQTHLAAGFGDVGYANRWTLEIVNLGKRTVQMWPGEPIAQIAWVHIGPVEKRYKGKYVQTYRDEWKPENMLPRWPVPDFDKVENGE